MKKQNAVYPYIAKFLFVSALGFTLFSLLLFSIGEIFYKRATGNALDWWVLPLLVIAITAFSLLLFASPFGEWSARHDSRALSPDKWQKNHPLDIRQAMECFEEVQQAAAQHYPSVSNVRLYIAEDASVNAFACGKRTIILNSALIINTDREALCGTIAHEFGHIINKDYRPRVLFAGIKFADTLLYRLFHILGWLVARSFALITRLILSIFGVSTNNMSWFDVFCEMVEVLYEIVDESFDLACNHLLLRREYEADKVACYLGYGEGLIDLLQNYVGNTYHLDGSEMCDSDTHPTNKNRIEKCHQIMEGSCE